MATSMLNDETQPLISREPVTGTRSSTSAEQDSSDRGVDAELERNVIRKVDLRLCTIAGLLCSLDLLDSGIISAAAVTSMPQDLGLTGSRYSIAIFIFTVAGICFQLPATILMRLLGPPLFFSFTTISFGLITLSTALITSWREMIVLRVLLGLSMSGIYPSLTYLISTWYKRDEQQLRFAFMQSGQIIILATGGIVNYGLNRLDGYLTLRGWQWMYIVQGAATVLVGFLTYLWMPHFPEDSEKTLLFLDDAEIEVAIKRIDRDRRDAGKPEPFTLQIVLRQFADLKLYVFSSLFFLLNLVSTALVYFLPIILQNGMGFGGNKAILLSALPYYYAVIPVVLTSYVGDKYRLRGPIIIFNAICLIGGFCMLGFLNHVTVRYIGVFFATGAYISNWAALNAYQANNITGQWKRATVAAAVTACNGLGGIAGSYIVRSNEAPHYSTAILMSIGSHVLTIFIIVACSAWFWTRNRQASIGKVIIEGVPGFQYTY